MRIKCRLGILMLVAAFVGGPVLAAGKGKAAVNQKAMEAEKAISAAEAARKKAASVDGEWRDTGKIIKKAKTAVKDGAFNQAIKLAKKAREQGEEGYSQAVSQQKLQIPSYLKPSMVAGAAAAGTVVAGKTATRITLTLESVFVVHNGKEMTIRRTGDKEAKIPAAFSKIGRACPPFCIQPMEVASEVETIGELEVLGYLKRLYSGDRSVLVVDSRTPDWVGRGTIPGSVNIPWNKINVDAKGAFAVEDEAKALESILTNQFGVNIVKGSRDFRAAKTLVLFCNGIWCPQSGDNIKTLIKLGYPAYKLKWYRGGMQDWASAGLSTIKQ
jgi:rhodanese-related sulfurtransferase